MPEINEVQDWRTHPLPAPWTWYRQPSLDAIYSRYDDNILVGIPNDGTYNETLTAENFLALKDWATATDSILQIHNNVRIPTRNGGSVRRPSYFTIHQPSWYDEGNRDQAYIRRYHYFLDSNLFGQCPSCEHMIFADTGECSDCGYRVNCVHCGHFLPAGSLTVENERYGSLCVYCGHACAEMDCDNLAPQYHTYCETHEVEEHCDHCGEDYFRGESEDAITTLLTAQNGRTVRLCNALGNRCERYHCVRCGGMSAEYNVGDGEGFPSGLYCQRCYDAVMYGDNTEEFDESVNMNAPSLQLPTIPGRENIRLVGVEIEGGSWNGTGQDIAQELYRQGLSGENRVMGYHHGGSQFAHVENDSSVDWEMVVGPVNMASLTDVRKLNNAIKIVKKAIKNETVKLDLRCGTHIHVGAERVSVASAFNLHHIYAYAEDVLYRLGAAKWPIHRAIRNNSQYCLPIKKHNDFRAFANEQGEHHNGLYFGNYFSAMMNSCQCGAVRFGQWEQCTCQNLGKCTFEFRIFNATANQRKLHAYLAITQSLVAKSQAMSILSASDADLQYPSHPWQNTRYKDLLEPQRVTIKSAWAPRLNWLVNHLPLTDKERVSVRYCVENSELKELGSEVIDKIFDGTYTQENNETQEVSA